MTACLQVSGAGRWFRRVGVACALAAVGLPACGGEERDVPADASGGRDAAMPDAPPGPGPGSGFVSNTPGATVVDVGVPAMPNLVLLSSNLLQEPTGGRFFQEWIGEVKNVGSSVVCGVEVTASMRNAAGQQLAVFDSFADAAPYQISDLPLTIGCLAPGDTGTVYDNGFVPTAVEVGDVRRIEIAISALGGGGAFPAPHTPIVSSHVAPVFTGFGVTGTLTGNGGPIYNIGLDIFPRDATGLVFGWLIAVDLETLPPGGTFAFTTTSVPTSFSAYRVFPDFIDGSKPPFTGESAARSTADGAAAFETAWRKRTARRAAAERARASRVPLPR
jgi:hypothetical protein